MDPRKLVLSTLLRAGECEDSAALFESIDPGDRADDPTSFDEAFDELLEEDKIEFIGGEDVYVLTYSGEILAKEARDASGS